MKNHMRFLPIVILMFSFLHCIPLFAQETQQKLHDGGKFFFRAGFAFPTEEKYAGGPAVSAGRTVPILEKLNIEVEGLLTLPQSNFLRDDTANSIGTGDLMLVSINLNLNYYFISSETFGLYIKAGAGYSFNIFSPTSAYEDLGFTIEEDLDNSIQFAFGAGADFPLSDNIILNFDVRYTLNSTNGTWTVTDVISSAEEQGNTESTLNSFVMELGIKI